MAFEPLSDELFPGGGVIEGSGNGVLGTGEGEKAGFLAGKFSFDGGEGGVDGAFGWHGFRMVLAWIRGRGKDKRLVGTLVGMTDLEKFRELMTSFGVTLEQLAPDGPRESRPYEMGRTLLVLRPADYDLGYDYPPVFVFDEAGKFSQVGSTV